MLIFLIGLSLLGPVFVEHDPMQTNPQRQFQPSDETHLLGTDLLGRDVLSRTLQGGRRSLFIAAIATSIAVIPGLLLGILTAGEHFPLAKLMLLLLNAFLAIPGLILALVVIALLGRNIASLIVAVGLSQIAGFAVVVRSAVLSVWSESYVDAAISIGAAKRHIILVHILPAVQQVILAYAGVVFSYALLNSAALTFLGLGGEPGVPDWGTMLADGRAAFRTAPWVAFAPGVMIALTVGVVNHLADQVQFNRTHRR